MKTDGAANLQPNYGPAINKKVLQENAYARVKILPYPIYHDSHGNELPLRNEEWIMVGYPTVLNIFNNFGHWTVDLGYDFIDGYTENHCAPNDGLKHGILKLNGTIRLHRDKWAQITPLSRHSVERVIIEQEQALARVLAAIPAPERSPDWSRLFDPDPVSVSIGQSNGANGANTALLFTVESYQQEPLGH